MWSVCTNQSSRADGGFNPTSCQGIGCSFVSLEQIRVCSCMCGEHTLYPGGSKKHGVLGFLNPKQGALTQRKKYKGAVVPRSIVKWVSLFIFNLEVASLEEFSTREAYLLLSCPQYQAVFTFKGNENRQSHFLTGTKRYNTFTMTGTVTHNCSSCSCKPPFVQWRDLAFATSRSRRLCCGPGQICCDHHDCGPLRKKRWCQRLVVLGILSVDQVGQSPRVSALKSAITQSLVTRSCQNYAFDLVNGQRGTEVRMHSILIFLLAEGEPPITDEEVRSWNDSVASVAAKSQDSDCCVEVARSNCCGSYVNLQELESMCSAFGAEALDASFLKELYEEAESDS